MTKPVVGVLRSEMRICGDQVDVTDHGIDVHWDSSTPAVVTLYTLDADRLLAVLEAAANGEPVESIMLSIEAAALARGD